MPNEQQLEVLRRGVEAWNQWREQNLDVHPDLSKVNLSGPMPAGVPVVMDDLIRPTTVDNSATRITVSLAGANLVSTNLSEADLFGSELSRAVLSFANLKGTCLRWANLSNADLTHATLTDANLSNAQLSHAKLFGANLSKADLRSANLNQVYLGGRADLSEAKLSNVDLSDAFLIRANLWGADLFRAKILRARANRVTFSEANLIEADLSGANLTRANFSGANLTGANLHDANLSETNFSQADLSGANLSGANLNKANLNGADLSETNFSQADLSGAHLENAVAIKTDFGGANLTGCHIYGIAAWDVKLERATQANLIITEVQPHVRVDDMELAQFIYLLLNRRKLRNVLTTLGEKAVLILGRFTERKELLDGIANKLRSLGFLPIIFDFERPTNRDVTETVKILAGLSRFVIADITNPRSVPLELQATVPDYMVPFVTVLQRGQPAFGMFDDLPGKYHWALPLLEYNTRESLLTTFEQKVVAPALEKAEEVRRQKALPALRRSAED